MRPFKLDDKILTDLRDTIEKNLGQMTLSKLESTYDNYSMPWVNIELQVKDIEEANGSLGQFMLNLRNEIEALNMQQAQVAVYNVKVKTSGGELILRYVHDLQLHSHSWWQADGLAHHLF